MSNRLDDRELLEQARALARVRVDPGDARHAIANVRNGVLAPRGRRRTLWITSGSIAAVALISIALMVTAPPPASAADQLRTAAETTRNYRGWVHVTPVADAKSGSTNAPVLKSLHINTANGTTAIAFEIFQARCVKMIVPSQKQQLMYSGLTNQLRVDSTADDLAAATLTRSAELPLKLADLLAHMKSRGLKEPQITQSTDGDLHRFEITPTVEPKQIASEFQDLAAGRTVVWCDPQSKLICRMQSQVDGKPMVLEYAYGDPEIRDIYDLGVPRTVTEVDDRAPATATASAATRPRVFDEPDVTHLVKDESVDLEQLRARIQKRMAAEFGDYVMIECDELKARGRHNREGAIEISARHGDRGLRARYLVAPAAMFLGGPGFPTGWPTPKLDDVLATVRPVMPVHLYGYDGKTLWETDRNHRAAFLAKEMTPLMAGTYFDVGRTFWSIQGVGPTFGKQTVEVLRDPKRPGLIVLRVRETSPIRFNNAKSDRQIDVTYWLDPARDDLPVEWIQRSDDMGSGKLDSVIHLVYLDFAQLADGRWYATHWQQRTSRPPTPGVVDDGVYRESHRQFFQGAQLPADWFGDPNGRLKGAWKFRFPTTATTAPAATSQPGS